MNIETKDILPKLKSAVGVLRQYMVIIFIGFLVLIYGFLVFKIGTVSNVDPDDEAVAEQLKDTRGLQIDQDAIDKILELKDQNIAVKSLFESARDNPFQD
jgi:hypothetical protein